MVAWGLDFSADADSYLVCKQDNAGCFISQIFTNGIGNRKGIGNLFFPLNIQIITHIAVTGASFIVIDGALKDGGEPFTMNVLEVSSFTVKLFLFLIICELLFIFNLVIFLLTKE